MSVEFSLVKVQCAEGKSLTSIRFNLMQLVATCVGFSREGGASTGPETIGQQLGEHTLDHTIG